MSVSLAAFVQARMSSRRFPGKVLAPFRGEPIISRIVRTISDALPGVPVIVVTSDEVSDHPLAAYLAAIGVSCFRGPLDDVFGRFCGCLEQNPCDWIVRVCADSPLLGSHILRAVVEPIHRAAGSLDVDLITTTAPRTFPKGQNAEVINATTLRKAKAEDMTPEDREHVTRYFHRHADRFRLLNIESGNPELASLSFAVDTIEDLRRLEELDDARLPQPTFQAPPRRP
jgi:spore coat polysaccharide biosynthesis protein SpsF